MYRGALYINYVYMLKDFRRNKGISMRTNILGPSHQQIDVV